MYFTIYYAIAFSILQDFERNTNFHTDTKNLFCVYIRDKNYMLPPYQKPERNQTWLEISTIISPTYFYMVTNLL